VRPLKKRDVHGFSWIFCKNPSIQGGRDSFWYGYIREAAALKDSHENGSSIWIYTIVEIDGSTPKRWIRIRGHDKPIHRSG